MSSSTSDQQQQPSAAETTQSIKAMEEALTQIFHSSFDADSKVCLVTLMKVLDNVLHKPGDDRVRSIKLSNAAFANKVANRPGGISFLLACGFTHQQPAAPLLSTAPTSTLDDVLVLLPADEKQSRLLTARRLLKQRAIQDLNMNEEELPAYREPPKLALTTSFGQPTSSAASSNNGNTFNPYVGHRYDAQSAAVGANLGPDANYVSPTDQQLRVLQQKQAKLEKAAAKQFTAREWKAWAPGETVRWNSEMATTADTNDSTTTGVVGGKSDASLLAQRAQALEAARQEREQGGFTTAAMREVAKLKNKKVYSHVQLTITFSDQMRVTGKYLPKETIGKVLQSLKEDCLLESSRELDLYVAPPRRLLPLSSTLEKEGLVPAAKIFVSWKVGSAPSPGEAYLQPSLFDAAASGEAPSFPAAQLIAQAPAAADKRTATTAAPKPKKKKESREEMMLKRMMGKK